VRKIRLTLRPNPQAWIANALHAIMREAAVTYQIAEETAWARVFDLTLVTADRQLIHARQVPILTNR
jgi:hypothetical protein